MIRDEVKIFTKAGDGGPGCIAFRREKYVAKGGPNGGDGGRGGHVILEADPNENTLFHLARNPHVKAKAGVPGSGNDKHGANGEDTIVRVPVGTIVKDAETGVVLKDLSVPGEQVIVAKGGIGGRGNARFKSATNQTPRRADRGRPGESRKLFLELKLIADVGLLGLPNAGKSTLVNAVSAATPKIADYPFTTLDPHPGIVELSGWRRFVMMDIPGLIEGASQGQGLGDRFLRHVERTKVLLHLVDLGAEKTVEDVAADHATIRNEIEAFGHGLVDKPRLTVFSKADTVPDPEARMREILDLVGGEGHLISAVTRRGLDELLEACWRLLHPDADSTDG